MTRWIEPFQACGSADPVVAGDERGGDQHGERRTHADLERTMAGTEQRRHRFAQRAQDLQRPGPVGRVLALDQRSEQRTDVLAQRELAAGKLLGPIALEHHSADRLAVLHQQHRANRLRAVALGQRGVRAVHARLCALGLREQQRGALPDGLFHGRADVAQQALVGLELGAVGQRVHLDVAASHQTHADAVALRRSPPAPWRRPPRRP